MKNVLFLILVFSIQFMMAQENLNNFFGQTDAFLKKHVSKHSVNYDQIKKSPEELNRLIEKVATADLSQADAKTSQAFFINSYNLLVIKGVLSNYPLKSVLDVPGFFDSKKYKVAGKMLTLNQLEKNNLLKTYKDARFHFVLVCGAVDCPPITNFAYTPAKLNQQLESRTRRALNDPNFIKTSQGKTQISQIFEWYSNDFGGSKKTAIEFINKYRENAIPSGNSVEFYNYDWSLNESDKSTGEVDVEKIKGNNASRYVVSAARPKGTSETKLFNNLYSQSFGDEENGSRSNFFTSSLSFVYGVTNRLNVGFDLRYRAVSNEGLPSSPLNVFGGGDPISTRSGITTIGPKIRWAPLDALPNFSVQSAFWFPIGEDLEGNNEEPFIDWNGATWWTQLFNDISIGNNFSLFTELDFLIEDIGSKDEGALNRFSTPATVIFSYFPNPKTTLYALTSYSPFWQEDFDYFAQAGLGAKYQFTPNFEVELLYTGFTNEFLQDVSGTAATYNLGIRITK